MSNSTFTIYYTCILLWSCSQPTKIVCGFPGTYKGEGTPSELLKMQTTGVMDTLPALLHHRIIIIDQSAGKPAAQNGVGVSVLLLKPGTDSVINSGTSDIKGGFDKFVMAGTYDVEYRFACYNPLKLKNLPLKSGEIKDIQVRLGIQGKEIKPYEVDVAGK